jgi:hypothetical protein
MLSNPTPEQLLSLMSQRNSARDKQEVPVTNELLQELHQNVLNKIPSGGNFRTMSLGLSLDNRIQIIATPLTKPNNKYGVDNARRILDLEAGTLAAYINLYLLTKGYQSRYYFHNTPDGLNIRLILELAIYPKD